MTWTSKAAGLLAAATVLASLAISSGADAWYLGIHLFGYHHR